MTDSGWYPVAEKYPCPTKMWRGNQGRKAVVMHVAQGSYNGTIEWFEGNSPATAHFLIGRDGRVAQFVSVNDSAWGNGISYSRGQWYDPSGHIIRPTWSGLTHVNPNWYTISVEHEGNYQDHWTDAMFDANTKLLQWLISVCPSLDPCVPGKTLIGHHNLSPIDRPFCPGPNCDFQAIADAVNGSTMLATYQVVNPCSTDSNDNFAAVRQGPARTFPEAVKGTMRLQPGTIIMVDSITNGWAHMARTTTQADLGFVHTSLLKKIG